MTSTTNRNVIVLGAILAAVVVVSILAIVLVSGPEPEETDTATPVNAEFNLRPIQRPEYIQLNRQLIVEGAVPVVPPPSVGKAIPFL